MKKTLSLFLLLFALNTVYGQELPKKGAKQLIITNSERAEENFKMTGMSLVDAGYVIKSKDREFGIIITEPFQIKAPNSGNHRQEITAIIKDNKVTLSSKTTFDGTRFIETGSPRVFKDVTYNKNTVGHTAFENMIKVAKKLKGEITYQ